MYKLKIVLFILIFTQISLYSKWIPITKHIESMDINDIDTLNTDILIAVGDGGVIYKIIKDSVELLRGDLTFNALYGIIAVNSSDLVAVGENSTILLNNNHGDGDWRKLKIDGSHYFKDIAIANGNIFILSEKNIFEFDFQKEEINRIDTEYSNFNKIYYNGKYLYVIGENGLLLKINPDNNFIEKIELNTDNEITAIHQNGTIILASVIIDGLYKSDDDFKTFDRIKSNNPLYKLIDFIIVDENRIYAVGSPSGMSLFHYYTEDKGLNWKSISTPTYFGTKFLKLAKKSYLVGGIGGISIIDNSLIDSNNFDGYFDLIHTGYNSFNTKQININGNQVLSSGQSGIFIADIDVYDWEMIGLKAYKLSFIEKNEIYHLKEKTENINGDKYYNYLILKQNNEKIDTVEIFSNQSGALYNVIQKEDITILYGYGKQFYFKTNEDKFYKKIVIDYNIQSLSYGDGIISIVTYINNSNTILKSNDLGTTWEVITNSNDYISQIAVYNNEIYYINTNTKTNPYTHELISTNKNFKSYKFEAVLAPGKLIISDNKIVIANNFTDVIISDDLGQSWLRDTLRNNASIHDVVLYNNNIMIADGNEIYSKYFDFLSSINNSEVKEPETIKIYPNPATNNVTFQLINESYIKQYKIYDLNGKLYDNKLMNVHLKNINVNIEELPVGTYFIEIIARGKIINKSFVKE